MRFPVNRVVQFNHAVAAGRRADKPAIQGVIEDRLVGAPAVRVVVDVLFNLEDTVLHLQHHADGDVEGFVLVRELRVVGILDEAALVGVVVGGVHPFADESSVQILEAEELTGQIDHRTHVAVLVHHHQRGDAVGFGHLVIVGTEGRGDVDDTRTVFDGYEVARDDAESTFAGIDPRNELLVLHTGQVRAFPFAHHLIWDEFVALLVVLQFQFGSLRIEISMEQILAQDHRLRDARVRIIGLNRHVGKGRADTERRVRRQGPGSSRPGQEERVAEAGHLRFRVEDAELRGTRRILHVAIAARLVQLVRTQARAGGRGIRLDGVALVEQALLVKLLQ